MVKGGFASTLGLTENKLMLKDEDLYTMYHAETCQVHLHNVKEKRLKFPLTRKHFEIFGGSGKLQGITKKIAPLYQEKIAVHCQESKGINEQSKYKSVPIFLFLVIEGKPEICNS